jgi:hypothetical protein
MTWMTKRSIAIAALILIGGGSLILGVSRTSRGQTAPPPPSGDAGPTAPNALTEVDTSPNYTLDVENGPPGYQINVQRAQDGTRTVSLWDGAMSVTLVSGQYIVHATGVWAGGATTVCAQVAPDFPNPTNMNVQCGVRLDGASTFTSTTLVTSGTNTFYQDLCMPGSGGNGALATIAFSSGDNPLLTATSSSPDLGTGAPCQSITFSSSGGGLVISSPVADGCSCDLLNGQPCPADPCWQGSGVMSGGACDHSTQTASCPAPQQCTGDPDAGLCIDPTDF